MMAQTYSMKTAVAVFIRTPMRLFITRPKAEDRECDLHANISIASSGRSDYVNLFLRILGIFCLIAIMGCLSASAQVDNAFEQGEILDFLEPSHSAYPSDTTLTIVKDPGHVTANPAIANIPGMEGIRGTWSAEIPDTLEGGAKIRTKLQEVQRGDIQPMPADSSESGVTIDLVESAYIMDIDTTRIGLTGPAQVEMSVSREWVHDNGGLEATRIFRYGNDGTRELLNTRFSNYDRDTGYINLKADSPHGLGMFVLVAVRQRASSQPDIIVPEPVLDIQKENVISETQESRIFHERLFTIQVAILGILLVLLIIGVTRIRKSFVHTCSNLPVFGLVIRMIHSSHIKR